MQGPLLRAWHTPESRRLRRLRTPSTDGAPWLIRRDHPQSEKVAAGRTETTSIAREPEISPSLVCLRPHFCSRFVFSAQHLISPHAKKTSPQQISTRTDQELAASVQHHLLKNTFRSNFNNRPKNTGEKHTRKMNRSCWSADDELQISDKSSA